MFLAVIFSKQPSFSKVFAQVQTRVKLRDLIGITVKHQRGLLGGKQATANAPFAGLAPAWMVNFRIHIGVETIFTGGPISAMNCVVDGG